MSQYSFNKQKITMIKNEAVRSIVWEIWHQAKGGGIRRVQSILRSYGLNVVVDGWLGNKSLNAINREGDRFYFDVVLILKNIMKPHPKHERVKKRIRSKSDGRNLLISTCLALNITDVNQIKYVLATVEHETNGTFKPVREAYWVRNKMIRRYGRREGSHRFEEWAMRHLKTTQSNIVYAPYYGRGYCQITWKKNYARFTRILNDNGFNVDLVKHPNKALIPEIASFIIVYGMIHGTFTGHKLSDYIRKGHVDFENSRRIINGMDKASRIAYLADKTRVTSIQVA